MNLFPCITVIVPAYNVEKWIPSCLDSIITNTYKNLEILCIDDGSTDRTSGILDQYASRDSRIRVIHQENRGIGATRNRGIEEASGSWISYVDADDSIVENYFEVLIQGAMKQQTDIHICGFKNVEEGEERPARAEGPATCRKVPVSEFMQNRHFRSYIWGRLYSKDNIGKIRFPEQKGIFEDLLFNYNLWADSVKNQKSLNIVYTDITGYYYLQRSNSMVHQANHKNWIINAEYMLQKGLEETNKEVRTFWLIRTIKRCLSARYDANVRGDADAVRKIQIIMEAAYRKMINERDFRLNKRLFYGAMIRFPQLYRQFRIRTNRGMVEWERHMKKVRAQEALGKQKNPE